MRYKKIIYIFLLLFITGIGLWGIPELVKKATYSPDSYPFVYYSSGLQELAIINFRDKENPMRDLSGNEYTTDQFDSLMPFLNYRELMVKGTLPDSIGGIEITPQVIRTKSVNYRYNPSQKNTPQVGLYLMYESMPKRVGLEMPEDVFRMKNGIEFIDCITNTVNSEKSDLFENALIKHGFQFPAHLVAGNPNPRKPYDEGYFCLDAKNDFYHLKMVNGRPYVRNTGIGEEIDIQWFSMLEVSDKRFYGFLYSREGEVYIVESREGKYVPVKLDIDPVDPDKNTIVIMGNPLYWTVSVTTPERKDYYALETGSLKRIEKYTVEREPGKWDKTSRSLFPVYLTFENRYDNYVFPALHFTGYIAFLVNIVFAIGGVILLKNRGGKRIFNFIYIFITGIAGFIALYFLPDLKK